MYFATANEWSAGPKAAMLIDSAGDIYALRKRFNGNLKITSTTQEKHIEFSRVEYNYITAPDGGTIAFNTRGTVYAVDCDLNITKGIIKPGKTNTTSLGQSNLRWSNIYSVLGNFSGQITSTVATGTAPFAISSTTKVDNLNADMLDG
jgi:hypothetical protein